MKPIHINQPIIMRPQFQEKAPIKKGTPQNSFTNYLNEATKNLKISKHAQQRIEQRKIDISASEWQSIEDKLLTAKQKGVKDTLVLTTNAALIVNVKNQMVITAMNRHEANDQVFTNIDGAIVL